MSSGPRVLVLSASIGGGHVAAARALMAAFQELGVEAEHADLLEHTALPFRRLYRQAYFDLVRTMPDLVEWIGRRLDRPSERTSVQRRLRARAVRLLSYEVPRIVDRYQPTVVVHTHFLGAQIMSGRMRRHRLLPQAVVITDFFAHAFWLQPGVARYFVASGEVRAQLLSAGVDEHRVRVTGIPIDLRFSELQSSPARASDLNREHLLVLAGGLGADHVRKILTQLKEFKWPLKVTVVCGRSSELATVAQEVVAEAPGPVTFEVLGFVTNMPELMSSATLALTKPGGLTSSEALAARLPMMLVSPYPLQEEINAHLLLENGVAVRVEPLTTLSHKLRSLLEEEGRLAAMRDAAARLAKPDAARSVARIVIDELAASAGRNQET
ncbi:MAG: glycosyltransferase [Trueperaceae bacterium]